MEWMTLGSSPRGARNFSSLKCPASYSVGNGGLFPGGKAAGARG